MRLFIAVAADEEIQSAAAEAVARLRRASASYRWVDPRDMHTTLRFIGEASEERIPQMRELMASAAAKTPPFELVYGAVGAFESFEDPRVVWIGLSEGKEPLEKLADLLGRDEPRPFSPHLTMGRRKGETTSPGFSEALKTEPVLSMRRPMTKISLYMGLPKPFGHAYEILHEAELTGV
jgi:2'-5' RNA ligase